jgi:hypothetical protein
MKTLKTFNSFLLGIFILSIGLTSCEDRVSQEVSYTANIPIYLPMNELLSTIEYGEPTELENVGKIYSFGSLLYIGERGKGVHILDNSDPSNPLNIGFLNIPGNKDIAIKGSYLYADCHTDLLVFKINGLETYEIVNRVESVFSYIIPEYNSKYPLGKLDQSKGIVIGYDIAEVTEDRAYRNYEEAPFLVQSESFDQNSRASFGGVGESSNRSVNSGSEGIGGSFAQFMLVDDYLYVMNTNTEISLFDISSPANPRDDGEFSPGWEIETLFKNDDKLFIGGNLGMYIYSVEDPSNPTYLSEFNHADACDPVVADDKFAYVTLRTGTQCLGQVNQLDVLDISDVYQPTLINTVNMSNPHGVGIDPENDVLFVCDGNDGLKVFRASEAQGNSFSNITPLQHIQGVTAYDVIPNDGKLMMIGEEGLYQFDYDNGSSWLSLLSVVNIGS